jgi:hypothetical protein
VKMKMEERGSCRFFLIIILPVAGRRSKTVQRVVALLLPREGGDGDAAGSAILEPVCVCVCVCVVGGLCVWKECV